MTEKTRLAPPNPSAMLESLRGLGYSTAAALADIIDNSIAAAARRVEIDFHWESAKSHITILDDGSGMDEPLLESAMRLGGRGPRELRSPVDLGRFGLGLKTASFSQCRVLTVASRKDWDLCCLRWDLDHLLRSAEEAWHLLDGPAPASRYLLDVLSPRKSGTLVIWEDLDRLVTPGFTEQDFLDLIDSTERYLGMIFGRFLSGCADPLDLRLNGRPVSPWDPFLEGHPATYKTPVEQLDSAGGPVVLQGFVLPQRSRLSVRDYEAAAGPYGWPAQQGFYVYRQRRLLVAGSWLGLGQRKAWTREEAHQLARIRLDITNTADEDWKIDVRKSAAQPPAALRKRLARFGEEMRKRARKVFVLRGLTNPPRSSRVEAKPLWLAEHTTSGSRYRIDQSHPAVEVVLAASDELASAVKTLLRLIEETVPVQRIWLDTAEGRDNTGDQFTPDRFEEVAILARDLYHKLVNGCGYSPAEAKRRIQAHDPFHNFPGIIAGLGQQSEGLQT